MSRFAFFTPAVYMVLANKEKQAGIWPMQGQPKSLLRRYNTVKYVKLTLTSERYLLLLEDIDRYQDESKKLYSVLEKQLQNLDYLVVTNIQSLT